jgi:Tol biopolymer transport system component
MNRRSIVHAVLSTFALFVACNLAAAQRTERVSVNNNGVQGKGFCSWASISADGRFVAFQSVSDNLVTGDTNLTDDIFVRDRLNGVTERVSVDSSGTQGDQASYMPAISADGRYVAFTSDADNFVAGDKNHASDVFVHDRVTGTTECVSVDSSGTLGDLYSGYSSISGDGRYVAFTSYADNLVPGDTNAGTDVFLRDRQTGITEIVSVDPAGAPGDAPSGGATSITADGRYVAFGSLATTLVAGDTNGISDVFVRDRQAGTTDRVSVDSSGAEADDASIPGSISSDGRFVAFGSVANNLVANDSNGVQDSFVRDRQAGTTTRVSVDSGGAEGNGVTYFASISADGGLVAFESDSTNLVPNDTNACTDVFVHDLATGTTERVSVRSDGAQANDRSVGPEISDDGRSVVFISNASNLVANDTNGNWDTFVRGPWLTLEADPPLVAAGATLTFSTWRGAAGGLALLVVTDVNGSPIFVPATAGAFDASGNWILSGTVPSGLSGNVVTFESLGFVPTGKVEVSNPVAVQFQ